MIDQDSHRDIRDQCEQGFQRLCELLGVHSDPELLGLAAAEIQRLRDIIDKLPKTADGVPVVPGMKVYVPAAVAGYWGQKPGKAVEFMVDWIHSEAMPIHLVFIQGQTYQILASRCYSTRQAAEEAK
jgi:hypothetical protein